jgi:hypothetical protein
MARTWNMHQLDAHCLTESLEIRVYLIYLGAEGNNNNNNNSNELHYSPDGRKSPFLRFHSRR